MRKRGGFEALFALDFVAWRQFGYSPIWLKFHYSKAGRGEEVVALFSKTNLFTAYLTNPRVVATPIMLTHSSDRPKVIQDGAQQIRAISRVLLDN